MSPEKHAIRHLTRKIEGATPEIADAIRQLILTLENWMKSGSDPSARAKTKTWVSEKVDALEALL